MHPELEIQTPEQLIRAVFRPARAALGAVQAALGAVRDPAAAWGLLLARGLLPAAWRDAPQRRFPALGGLPLHERSQRLRWAPYTPQGPHPDTLDACTLLAADVGGVEAAEAHGLHLCRVQAPWGYPESGAVLWVPSSLSHYAYQLTDTKPGVWEPPSLLWRVFPGTPWLEVRALRDRLGAAAGGGDAHHAADAVAGWLYGQQRWDACVARGERVPGSAPAAVAGQPFSALPSPFLPGLRLLQTGYAPLPSGNGLLVLGYPSRAAEDG